MALSKEVRTQVVDNLRKAASAIRELSKQASERQAIKAASERANPTPVINLAKLRSLLHGTQR